MKTKITAIVLFCLFSFVKNTNAEKLPNWWVILADDISKEYIYGNRRCPNLEIMSREGVRFNQAWAAPVCSVTRANLLTGSLARYHGVTQNGNRTNGSLEPLPKIPGQSGLFGKWNVPGFNHDEIFDYWFMWSEGSKEYHLHGYEDRSTASRFYNPAIDHNGVIINTFGQYGPHLIADAALSWASDVVKNTDEPFLVWHMMFSGHGMRNGRYPTPPGFKFKKDNSVTYQQNLADMDNTIGEILNFARSNNTIVVFASDNPTAKQGKNEASPEGCSIPMIVWGPGWILPIQKVGSSIQLRDLYATIYESRKLTPPAGSALNSISMWGALNRGESFARSYNITDYEKVSIVQKRKVYGVAPRKGANLKTLKAGKGKREFSGKKPSRKKSNGGKGYRGNYKKFKKERSLKVMLLQIIKSG